MLASVPSEPDRSGIVLFVGQDRAGHWLVQDSARRLEGRFVSFDTAMAYAKAERHLHHARVELASIPLWPIVPFTPMASPEPALAQAA